MQVAGYNYVLSSAFENNKVAGELNFSKNSW